MERQRKRTAKARKPAKKKTNEDDMLSPEEVWQVLLGMGAGTSFVELREALLVRHAEERVPTLKTIYAWSSKYKWRDRLSKLETMTQEKMEELIVQDKAKYRARQIGMLAAVSEHASAKVLQTLANADEAFNNSIRNASDLKRLIDMAVTAGQHAELLDGRATGRQDIRKLQEDQDDDVVLQRANRILGRRGKLIEGQAEDEEDAGSGMAGNEGGSSTAPGSDQLH